MAINLSLPELGLKGSSTKDQIVSILSHEWPLTVKEIFNRVNRESQSSVSYQAVHKVLTDLCGRGILCKAGKSFELDKSWLQSQKSFFERVSSDYLNSKDRYEIDPNFKGTVRMHFNDYTTFVVSIATMFRNKSLVGSRPEPGLGVVRHAHWPLRFSFDDFTLLRKMMQNNRGGFALIKTDSPLDRWVIQQYMKGGFDKVKIVPELHSMKEDLIIHGDGIMNIAFSDETISMMNEAYSKIPNLSSLFKEFAKNAFSKEKVSIDVKISKNPELAKTLQEHFMTYFDKALRGGKQ